jgi:ribosome-binding ATPase YchF (GTP1/OBG family)
VGETWTGKSNLFLRITQNKFNPDTFGTIGSSYAVQKVKSVDDELIKGKAPNKQPCSIVLPTIS